MKQSDNTKSQNQGPPDYGWAQSLEGPRTKVFCDLGSSQELPSWLQAALTQEGKPLQASMGGLQGSGPSWTEQQMAPALGAPAVGWKRACGFPTQSSHGSYAVSSLW